jgi:hypothetical protein
MCWGFHGSDRVPLEDVGGTPRRGWRLARGSFTLGRLLAKAVWRGFQLYQGTY